MASRSPQCQAGRQGDIRRQIGSMLGIAVMGDPCRRPLCIRQDSRKLDAAPFPLPPGRQAI
jgi:hypothetical protein